MQLSGKDIEKCCDRGRLLRGKALYASKAVQELTVIRDKNEVREWISNHCPDNLTKIPVPEQMEEDQVWVVTAEVVGSRGEPYACSLLLNEDADDKILYASCECPDYIGGTTFCKHCVAVAHNIVMKLLEEKLSDRLVSARDLESAKKTQESAAKNDKKGEKKKEKRTTLRDAAGQPLERDGYAPVRDRLGIPSSGAVTEWIRQYAGVDASMYWKEAHAMRQEILPDEPIQLFPNLQVDRNGQCNMELRIGSSEKKYVIRDIDQFCMNMKYKQYFMYGKSLGFLHDRAKFAPESEYYIDMMEDLRSAVQRENIYETPRMGRYVHLSEGYLERTLVNAIGGSISINGEDAKVVEKNPSMTLRIESTVLGANVYVPNHFFVKGLRRYFMIDLIKNVVYVLSEGFQQNVVPFIQTAQEQNNMGKMPPRFWGTELEVYLSQRDYVSFCGHVLRRVEPYFTIEEYGVQLRDSMPEECRIRIYLDEPSGQRLTCRIEACYGEQKYNPADWEARAQGNFRELSREEAVYQTARQYFPKESGKGEDSLLYCESEENIYRLLEEGMSELAQHGELYVSDTIRRLQLKKAPRITAGVQVHGDLLELNVDIPEMSSDEIGEILKAYRLKRRYYRMRNGDFLQLEDSGLSALADMSSGLGLTAKDWTGNRVELPLYRANYIDATIKERGKNMRVVRSREFKSIIRDMREVADSDYEVPTQITAELREYQKTGYRWLRTLAHYGFGGILADDMGLGKTLQIITLLQSALTESETVPCLVVCPASLVYNWESEFHKFAPDIRVRLLTGTAAQRRELLADTGDTNVIVTSYDLLKRDLDWYEDKQFAYMIIDEAQYIKNAATKVARAVKSISAKYRFALTGTPLENRLSDLWSIFDFVMKGYLYSYPQFRKDYEIPIVTERDEDALQRLKRLTTPFILRRRKKEVLRDLPDKIENVVYTTMTSEQEKYYRARYSKLRQDLAGKTKEQFQEDRLRVLAEITRLRQICCDPGLFIENYSGGSGKVDAFLSMAEELIAGGSNILVFSQFATMLEILREGLQKLDIHTLMLTGQSSKEERRSMVEEFQAGQSTVFLISLKAGGTGLNLTAADTVIHFDPWWNVAVQNQATDRAHRIGQDKVVTVTQLVMKHSIEERVIALQNEKKQLVEDVMETEGVASAALNRDEILKLLEEF